MSKAPTEQEFLKHVAGHELTVIRDEGLHRHLRFKTTESLNRYFDLITWPGSLCFTGDMGTYVFSRIPDMFEFFRSELSDSKLHINTGYWSEKLDAADRRTGGDAMQYSPELFRKNVREYLKNTSASKKVRQEVERQVIAAADDGEWFAYHAAMSFEYEGFQLRDFYEYNSREYTYAFVWCCYALVWGIKRYDELKAIAPKEKAATP